MRLCELPCKSDQFKIKVEDPLIAAIRALSRGSHVLLVVDEHDRLRGLITAFRILNLLPTITLNPKLINYPVSLFVNERALTMHYEYPIEAALQLMVEEGKNHLVAVDGLKVVNLLTHRCFLDLLSNQKLELDLRKLILKDITVLLAHNSLAEAIKAMKEVNYYEIPMVEDEVVGILRLRDVIDEAINEGFEKLKSIKVFGKCKLVNREVRGLNDALELALKEEVNLIPVLKSDGGYCFVKLEDIFAQLVREYGAFKIAEMIKLNNLANQPEISQKVSVHFVASR